MCECLLSTSKISMNITMGRVVLNPGSLLSCNAVKVVDHWVVVEESVGGFYMPVGVRIGPLKKRE